MKKNATTMATVIYEEVKNGQGNVIPGYHRAKYGDLDVIVNKMGRFNLSKICYLYVNKKGKHSKEYCDWASTPSNQELIEAFRRDYIRNGGNPRTFLTEVGNNQQNEVRGTYGTEALVVLVAIWTNKEYAVNAIGIITDHYKKEAEKKMIKLSAEKDAIQEKLDYMIEQNNKLLSRADQVLGKLDDVQDELGDVKEELTIVNTRVEVLVKEVVPPNKHKNLEERVGFMKLNNPDCDFQFKTYRTQKCHVDRARADIRTEHPEAKLWLETPVNPNSVNCLNRLKELYRRGKSGKLVFSYNSIKLNNGTTEAQFKQMIDEILAQPVTYGQPEDDIVAASPSKTKKKSSKSA